MNVIRKIDVYFRMSHYDLFLCLESDGASEYRTNQSQTQGRAIAVAILLLLLLGVIVIVVIIVSSSGGNADDDDRGPIRPAFYGY